MPRKQPPPGYMTAGDATKVLGVTRGMLAIYVQQGKLKRYGPETRQHKFYKASEVEALAMAEKAFFSAEPGLVEEGLVFRKATVGDMEMEGYLAFLCFGPRARDSLPYRFSFLAHNPDIFYHLYDRGYLAAAINVVPLTEEAVKEFKQGKRGWLFSLDQVGQFEPVKPLRLIIIDFMTAPVESAERRAYYGQQLLMGLAHQLAEWGAQGIEILSVHACGASELGRQVLKGAGFAELGEPVLGRVIFELDVPSSSLKLLRPYREALAQWRVQQRTSNSVDAPA